jgi:hypothetical protein
MGKTVYSRLSNYLLITVLVIIVALSAVKLLLPAESYREQITQQLTEISNTAVEVRGSLEWYLSPLPSLSINEIYLDDLKISLKKVNLSFSLLDFIFLEASPTHLQIGKVVTTINNAVITPVEQLSFDFDKTGHRLESFSLLIPAHSSLSPTADRSTLLLNGSINQSDTDVISINGKLTKEGGQAGAEPYPFDFLNINAKLDLSDQSKAVDFNIDISSESIAISSKGNISFHNQSPSIYFEEVKTPNITLSGTSNWSENESVFKSDYQSTLITLPDTCFSANKRLSIQNCYDLALLMMLPGRNHITIETLLSHEQTIKNISFYWQTSDGKISISDLDAQVFDGQIHLEAGYKISTSHWNFSLNSSGINVEKLLSAYSTEPQLFGTGATQLTGTGEYNDGHAKNYKVSGNLLVADGKTELFNLEKQLCTQVKGVVITDSISTPFTKLSLAIDLQNDHLQIAHFNALLDGAQINGQGELSHKSELQLAMNVNVDKQDWSLCKIPRALTSIEWPLTCTKQLGGRGSCSINLKQMGISALLLAESPETKDKAKQKVRELKESNKVKKALSRLDKWLSD